MGSGVTSVCRPCRTWVDVGRTVQCTVSTVVVKGEFVNQGV